MKQTITPEQLNELSEKQIKTFLDWVFSKLEEVDRSVINNMALELDEDSANGLYVEHITIGIMIEFLSEKFFDMNIKMRGVGNEIFYYLEHDRMSKEIGFYSDTELVDLLWFAVKYELSGVGE